MKRRLFIIFLSFFCLQLSSCASLHSKYSTPNDRLQAIQQRGTLLVAIAPDYFPYEYISPEKKIQGVDIQLAQYIADALGVSLKFITGNIQNVFYQLETGNCDLAISALTYTLGRDNAFLLSQSYLTTDAEYGIMVRREDASNYVNLSSLQDARIVSVKDSPAQALARNALTGYALFVAESTEAAFYGVNTGKIDACVCLVSEAEEYILTHPEVALSQLRFDHDEEVCSLRIAAPKEGSDSLIQFVNQCITSLEKENTILHWYKEELKFNFPSNT